MFIHKFYQHINFIAKLRQINTISNNDSYDCAYLKTADLVTKSLIRRHLLCTQDVVPADKQDCRFTNQVPLSSSSLKEFFNNELTNMSPSIRLFQVKKNLDTLKGARDEYYLLIFCGITLSCCS